MQCQDCGSQIAEMVPVARFCPYCGGGLDLGSSVPWKAVGRFSDLAEAGYVADALEGVGIPARVEHRNDLVSSEAAWSSLYILQVRESDAARAIEHLRLHLQIREEESQVLPDERFRPTVMVWGSLALILLAGGLGYVVGRSSSTAQAQAPPEAERFWKALRDSPPLESQRRPDEHLRRLRYNRLEQRFELEEDIDGDGSVDRRHALMTELSP